MDEIFSKTVSEIFQKFLADYYSLWIIFLYSEASSTKVKIVIQKINVFSVNLVLKNLAIKSIKESVNLPKIVSTIET